MALGYFLSSTVTDRIHLLQHAAEELSEGKLETRVSVSGRDEVAALGKSFNQMASQLQAADEKQRELESLLRQLKEILADIPPPPLERKPFKSMRGKLPWPAVGRLVAKYNSLKGTANLRWKGMFIGAKLGNNVRAIYHGRVAFADWMNGFGLILLIDHGDGYMSIYANCQELHKSQGEWVQPGDIICRHLILNAFCQLRHFF